MVGHLKDHLFGGNRAAFVAHLLEGAPLSSDELANLRALIEAAETKEEGR